MVLPYLKDLSVLLWNAITLNQSRSFSWQKNLIDKETLSCYFKAHRQEQNKIKSKNFLSDRLFLNDKNYHNLFKEAIRASSITFWCLYKKIEWEKKVVRNSWLKKWHKKSFLLSLIRVVLIKIGMPVKIWKPL